jgi:hypothetical protein
LLERISLPSDLPRFPQPRSDSPQLRLEGGGLQPDLTINPMTQPTPSLAELVSVHSDGRININTAPAALLREAYRVFGLGDAAPVLEMRTHGVFASVPATAPVDGEPGLRLVTTSDTWEALISVTRAGIQRRWWVVIAGNPPELRIVQRHDADG